MDKAIVVANCRDGVDLKRYLESVHTEFSSIRVLDKAEVKLNAELCKGLRYIFSTWNMPIFSQPEVVAFFPNVRAVFYAGGDIRYFLEPFAKCNIDVFSAHEANAIAVAEFVLAQVLLANKGYFQASALYPSRCSPLSFRRARTLAESKAGNSWAKVGIIGFGATGSALVDKLRQFEFEILVYDPFIEAVEIEQAGATRADLEEIFESCDVVSNHLPDNVDTISLLEYCHFSRMKKSATFINTGRGRQVDEKGLARAMREAPLRCALLDVNCREPRNPNPALVRCKNVFFSPHIAGSLAGECRRLYEMAFSRYSEYKRDRS